MDLFFDLEKESNICSQIIGQACHLISHKRGDHLIAKIRKKKLKLDKLHNSGRNPKKVEEKYPYSSDKICSGI